MSNTIDVATQPVPVEELVEFLHRKYPTVDFQVLREEVSQAMQVFQDARVTSYIPVLVERQVRRDLHLARQV